jgi:hypothetical protein
VTGRSNPSRLVGIATFLFAFLTAYLVYQLGEPGVEAARLRLEEANAQLRADDALFAERTPLETAAARLRLRYRSALSVNSQAAFVRDLDANVRRHGVTIVATSFRPAPTTTADSRRFNAFLPPHADATEARLDEIFDASDVTLQLRGSYRALLATISELSTGSQIVRVDIPSLRRDGASIVATVPATLLRPLADAPPQASAPQAQAHTLSSAPPNGATP